MKKLNEDRKRWIEETQMFQRIALVEESSAEDLGAEWDSWHTHGRMKTAKAMEIIAQEDGRGISP